MQREEDCEAVARAHGLVFKGVGVQPANTLIVSGLIGKQLLVEIEADAELGFGAIVKLGA